MRSGAIPPQIARSQGPVEHYPTWLAGRLSGRGADGWLEPVDQVINFLLTTEIIPLCLRIMETGNCR